jgi:4-diphosphocytidyl-2-C-methyl-D-erythritol kinase
MAPLVIRSYAKINWALRVLGKRPDGFHDLETLFQSISLHDTLRIAPLTAAAARGGTHDPRESVMTCDDPAIPADASNLVLRAATAMQARFGAPAVSIQLAKRIPAGGGLGGGSSNAAMTLFGIDRLFSIGAPPEELRALALSLGSDVPFFLLGGTAYATGRGERLQLLHDAAPIPLLLILPEERVLTAEAFRLVAEGRSEPNVPAGIAPYRTALYEDLLARTELLTNDFEPPIFERLPRLAEWKSRLLETGAAWAAMTGSGSTIVGAFRSPATRDAALDKFRDVRCEAAETIPRFMALPG